MFRYFVPYSGTCPTAIDINGHKLLIVSSDKSDIEECLDIFGADCIKTVDGGISRDDCHDTLERLAEEVAGDVLIAPEDAPLQETLLSLEQELPWLQ